MLCASLLTSLDSQSVAVWGREEDVVSTSGGAIFYEVLDKTSCNVTDRDLETDRDMERFVEPHTPALSRLSFHTADRRAPKFNMAPTSHAESDRKDAIHGPT